MAVVEAVGAIVGSWGQYWPLESSSELVASVAVIDRG